MIISAKAIRKSRVFHPCEVCQVPIEGGKIRLYGAASEGDPPSVLYVHPFCVSPLTTDEKALTAARELEEDHGEKIRKQA